MGVPAVTGMTFLNVGSCQERPGLPREDWIPFQNHHQCHTNHAAAETSAFCSGNTVGAGGTQI